ncbi:MAG: single-stranded DNA-binding protein [Novosphingobium sp.]|nr:single-stranded DNA-binding protein [Novosphingobium sp.]MCE2842031.1 single-stranded DNA-binding protein [Novosphingobium sp.]
MLTMQVIGNLGKDPEFKTLDSGRQLCSFSLASNKKIKGEKVTTWVNVTVFDENKIKFLKEYVRKGSKLFAEGEPSARAYLKDGEAKHSLDLTLGFNSKLEILSSERAENSGGYAGTTQPAATADALDDAIPGWD